MDLGSTAKKLQRATTVAEKSYKRINELLDRIKRLQEDLETTSSQVDSLEREVAAQRAVLEALAEAEGVDTDAVIDAAELPSVADADDADDGDANANTDSTTDADNDDSGDTAETPAPAADG